MQEHVRRHISAPVFHGLATAPLLFHWIYSNCECCRRKQDEVNTLEDTIRQRSEQQRKAGVELEATCHICMKTKFADGVGHICNYCNIRCCARCGGKTTVRAKVSCVKDGRLERASKWNCVVAIRRSFGCVCCVAKNRNYYRRLDNGSTKLESLKALCDREV